MSCPLGVGDIIQLTSIAWKLYKAYKNSSTDFAQLSMDILCLHAVLGEVHDFMSDNPTMDTSRHHRLTLLCAVCEAILVDMEALHTRYDNLGTHAQRTWDRMRFGLKDLADLRGRLVSSVSMLTAWHVTVVKYATSTRNTALFLETLVGTEYLG